MKTPALPQIFKALGDERRWRMLEFIARNNRAACGPGECVCACDVQDFIGLAQPTVSQHLKILVEAGLLDVDRRGKWNYYALRSESFELARAAMGKLQALVPAQPRFPKAAPERARSKAAAV